MLVVNNLEDGVPTSYCASVQFVARPTVIDDPVEKAEILTAQLGDKQPEGRHAHVAADQRVIGYLQERDQGLDSGAAGEQRRRLAAIGDWKTHRGRP